MAHLVETKRREREREKIIQNLLVGFFPPKFEEIVGTIHSTA